MRKRLFLILVVIFVCGFLLYRQDAESGSAVSSRTYENLKPHFGIVVKSGKSKTVTELTSGNRGISGQITEDTRVSEISRNSPTAEFSELAARDTDAAPATFGGSPMPTPSLSFDGLANSDNVAAYNLLIIPPDMNGDVGPNHYVQVVNSLLRIFDKSGTPVSPPFKISSLFTPLGTLCSTRNDGLPNVLYDPLADRWLITQTCTSSPPFRQMVAVSTSGDPTGSYFVYEFVMPANRLNDFPKFGVWTDGYYMAATDILGSDFIGHGVFAFDRSKLLRGDPSAGYIYFHLPATVPIRRGGFLPSDLDGIRPPLSGAPNIFAGYTAIEYGDPQDAVRLFAFHADFADPVSSTFTELPESPLTVAAFDPTSPEGRADISQPEPGDKLDSVSDTPNYRLAYRNLGTHESLVFNQTVRVSPVGTAYRAGVRLYELQRTDAALSVTEQTTISDGESSRWIGSAATDHLGNLAVQYNYVNPDKKPSIKYSGRLASEPAGTFRPEKTLVNGSGVQKVFGWRWGEYSGMTVDPVDDCTFWITNAYFTQESENFSDYGWLTRIGSFKFAECQPAPRASVSGAVTNSANSAAIQNAVVSSVPFTRTSDVDGGFGTLTLLPGTYNLTATAPGFRPQTVSVSLVDGQNLTQNFSLQPLPILENAGIEIAEESCRPNRVADPGETVTFNIALQNTGARSTQNLTAELLESGGVTGPGPAQNFGVLTAGGTSISRPFSFRIAPSTICGNLVVLTFRLKDGSEELDEITINLPTGAPRIAFRERFDRIFAPSIPTAWRTASSSGHQLWRTAGKRRQSGRNSVFSPAPHQLGVNELLSPIFAISTPNARLSFRNWYELETTFLRNRLYDGSVLEIKIGNGNWIDFEAAGGSFITGGYDGVIDSCCQNPLAGRRGWSGKSGISNVAEFVTTSAMMPPSAAGQQVQLRFRIGTDIGSFREGQYIDDLIITDGYSCGCQLP